jgi:hypothetical protein
MIIFQRDVNSNNSPRPGAALDERRPGKAKNFTEATMKRYEIIFKKNGVESRHHVERTNIIDAIDEAIRRANTGNDSAFGFDDIDYLSSAVA